MPAPWLRTFRMMLRLTFFLAACTVHTTTAYSLPTKQPWSTQWIAPLPLGLSRLAVRRDDWPIGAAALHAGEAVICVPDMITEGERTQLLSAGTARAAAEHARGVPRSGVEPTDGVKQDAHSVRLHIPKTLAATEIAMCDTILARVLRFVDAELPCLSSYLFASALCDLHEQGQLDFSANEPAINVYYKNGAFNPHKDYCALTVLIPLSSPDDGSFSGSGTGFWPPEERRRAGDSSGEPALVLVPQAGTAMLFSGHVTHAGMPVAQGTRVVFVASFTRQFGDEDLDEDVGDDADAEETLL